ncbi:hypothetical protein AWC38_SpisGene12375 [Stylophora pistillata]|uniref:Sushi domain-containing protein n=1 Tax=Stylophora pistillata TaxID=50429 RepID=A0A2B4S3B9_STYPI|nr:hypothetical protein AWC38_SpisGene12375 [Stylophora pistillata]
MGAAVIFVCQIQVDISAFVLKEYLLKPGNPLTCQGVTRCAILSVPSNGSSRPCSNLPGNTCQFSCDEGYILSGSATRTCRTIARGLAHRLSVMLLNTLTASRAAQLQDNSFLPEISNTSNPGRKRMSGPLLGATVAMVIVVPVIAAVGVGIFCVRKQRM